MKSRGQGFGSLVDVGLGALLLGAALGAQTKREALGAAPTREASLLQVSAAKTVTRVEADIIGDGGGVDLAPYLQNSVLPVVRANWYRFVSRSSGPNSAGTMGGETTIEFEILVDGSLGPVRAEASGRGGLDELALKVIQKSAPFPTLPSGGTGRNLNLRCHFYFNPPLGGGLPSLPSADARSNGKNQEEGAVLRSCTSDRADPSAGNCITAPQAIYSPVPAAGAPEAGKTRPKGVVTLSLIVGADGKASGVQVVKSLDPDLDKKAMDAVSTWKFKPGMKDGAPVAVQILVEVKFDPH